MARASAALARSDNVGLATVETEHESSRSSPLSSSSFGRCTMSLRRSEVLFLSFRLCARTSHWSSKVTCLRSPNAVTGETYAIWIQPAPGTVAHDLMTWHRPGLWLHENALSHLTASAPPHGPHRISPNGPSCHRQVTRRTTSSWCWRTTRPPACR